MSVAPIRKILAGALAAALALAAAGCAGNARKAAPAHDDSLQRVMLEERELVMGLDGTFSPMAFTDESGEIVGFDVDVAQEVCDRLGIRLVKKVIDWSTKEDALNSGEIDCIWGAMSATPARAETMNLSDPYMQNELIFVVSRDSDVRVMDDLRGKRVGVQPASTVEEVLEASDIYPDITVVLTDHDNLLRKLQDGELDAILTDSVLAYYFLYTSEEQYYVLSDSLGEEGYVIGFRKGDQALRDKVQEIIYEMGADGTLGEICRKWFGCDITIVR